MERDDMQNPASLRYVSRILLYEWRTNKLAKFRLLASFGKYRGTDYRGNALGLAVPSNVMLAHLPRIAWEEYYIHSSGRQGGASRSPRRHVTCSSRSRRHLLVAFPSASTDWCCARNSCHDIDATFACIRALYVLRRGIPSSFTITILEGAQNRLWHACPNDTPTNEK